MKFSLFLHLDSQHKNEVFEVNYINSERKSQREEPSVQKVIAFPL